MTAKAPKARVFTKKKRGIKKFVAEHNNLIRNEAQQAGLLEYDHARMGYVLPKNITPEMIEVAKAAQQRARKGNHSVKVGYNILRGEQKPAKGKTDWAIFWAALEMYDRAHKSTVTAAMKAWLDANPSVKAMKNKPRLEALKVAASKMIAYLDKDSMQVMTDAMDVSTKSPNVMPIYTAKDKICKPFVPEHKRIKIRKSFSTVYRWQPKASSILSIA
ncbi:MAG: hypothetical protein ACRCXB_23150 [Aeromonadaceae bacterium]